MDSFDPRLLSAFFNVGILLPIRECADLSDSFDPLLLASFDEVESKVLDRPRDEMVGSVALCLLSALVKGCVKVPDRGRDMLIDSFDPLLLSAFFKLGIMLPDGIREGRAYSYCLLLVSTLSGLGNTLPDGGCDALSDSIDSLLLIVGIKLPNDCCDAKLVILEPPPGGCGKAAILIVFRRLLPIGLTSPVAAMDVDLKVGTFDVEFACCGCGAAVDKVDLVNAPSASFDDPCNDEGSLLGFDTSEGVGKLFRDRGRGGKATVGGFSEGRDGCGRVAAILQGFLKRF